MGLTLPPREWVRRHRLLYFTAVLLPRTDLVLWRATRYVKLLRRIVCMHHFFELSNDPIESIYITIVKNLFHRYRGTFGPFRNFTTCHNYQLRNNSISLQC